MKSKRNPEIVITALICFGLIVMVLWVYYGAVFGEKMPQKKKEVSVVLYHSGDDGWESLMEGVKQAEKDFSVNINYVTVKKDMTGEEQAELVRQEIERGAQGILLAVADSAVMPQELVNEGVQVPIITMESGADAAAYTFFSADNEAMGKALGEEIRKDFADKDKPKIVVVEECMERNSVRERALGLYESLESQAEILKLQRTDERIELSLFLANELKRSNADVVVALNKESLQALGEISKDVVGTKKVYGIGNAASIVTALDKGKIEKLVFQNEFNIGYLSVEALVKEMDGIQSKTGEIDFYCVGKGNVHEKQYERLLFPIVE